MVSSRIMLVSISLVLLGIFQPGDAKAGPTNHTVCYPNVGCFDSQPPFDNSHHVLPKSPDSIDAGFHLYTPDKFPDHETLDYTNDKAVATSTFDPKRKTKILIHGFSANLDVPWVTDLKDLLVKQHNCNVLLVGWGKGAKFPDYDQATANLRLVAAELGLLVRMMVKSGMDLKDLHFIGHSLGAHMSGLIGHHLDGQVGRITGLDPAQPNFEHLDELVRLDAKDAIFVDVIHTDAANYNPLVGGYGLKQPSGDVDIYVNGGNIQPGCKETYAGLLDKVLNHGDPNQGMGKRAACSHDRSHDYFVDAVRNEQCSFTSYPCKSYDHFEFGACLTCDGGCSTVGLKAEQMSGRGIHYVNTMEEEPFCGKAYAMKLMPVEGNHKASTHGTLYMAVEGDSLNSSYSQVTPLKMHMKNSDPVYHVAMFEDVGTPRSVTIKYSKSEMFLQSGTNDYTIGNVLFKDAASGVIYQTTEGPYKLHTDVPLTTGLSAKP